MARPPKGRDDQLSETLRCRMRPAEYLRVRQQAARARVSLSDYARTLLLTGQVTIRQVQSLDADAIDQLRKIGINLNQAVHKLHATGEIPPELASAAAVVEAYILGMIDDP
jgi:Mobilization protein NikA